MFDLKRIFCIHHYKPKAKQDVYWDNEKGHQQWTRVLEVCSKCGKVKVTTLDGEWELEELRKD